MQHKYFTCNRFIRLPVIKIRKHYFLCLSKSCLKVILYSYLLGDLPEKNDNKVSCL